MTDLEYYLKKYVLWCANGNSNPQNPSCRTSMTDIGTEKLVWNSLRCVGKPTFTSFLKGRTYEINCNVSNSVFFHFHFQYITWSKSLQKSYIVVSSEQISGKVQQNLHCGKITENHVSRCWCGNCFEKDKQCYDANQMQPMWLCIFTGRQFEEAFENTQWRKVKQMQPMWICILFCKRFEDTFENAQWRKDKQMQPVWF